MDTLLSQSDYDWRNDIQSYLFDLMNDQASFKRTMSVPHSPSTHYQEQDNSIASMGNNDENEASFRERYFRDACQEIIQYQNRHGIGITSYKDPPDWIAQQNSNNKDCDYNNILTPFISSCIKERQNRYDIWQTDKAADNHLSILEKQWSSSIPWKQHSIHDIEFAQSLYLLESPLITLSTIDRRVLPTWTLQNRARMLPIMKVPHITDDNKSSIPEKLADHFSMSEQQRQISVDQTVFDELNQLVFDPFDNKSIMTDNSNNFPGVNNDVIWSDFSRIDLFDEESVSRSWISHPSLKKKLCSASIITNNSNSNDNNNTKHKTVNNTYNGSDKIAIDDSHTLESTTTYSNLNYDSVLKDSIVGYNNENQNHDNDFTNREYNNTITTDPLSSSLSPMGYKSILPTAVAMVSEYPQQQDNHNKLPSPIISGTGEEEGCAVVDVKSSMYVDAVVGIRRVNEYAGKRRKLEGLTNEEAITDHSKRKKQESVSSIDYYNTNSSRDSSPDLQQQTQKQQRRKPHSSETSFVEETLSAIGCSPRSTEVARPFVTKTEGLTVKTGKERSLFSGSSHISTFSKQNATGAAPISMHPRYQFTYSPTSPTKSGISEINQPPTYHEQGISSITTASHAHGQPQYISQHHNINSNNSKPIHTFSNQTLGQSTGPVTGKNLAPATKTLPPSTSFSTTASSLPFSRQQRQPKSLFTSYTDNCSNHAPMNSFMNVDSKRKQQQQQIIDSHSSLSVSGWKLTYPNTIIPNDGFSPSANITDFVAMRKVANKGRTNIHHHPSLSSTSTLAQQQQWANGSNRNSMPFCELRRLHDNLNEKHHFE